MNGVKAQEKVMNSKKEKIDLVKLGDSYTTGKLNAGKCRERELQEFFSESRKLVNIYTRGNKIKLLG